MWWQIAVLLALFVGVLVGFVGGRITKRQDLVGRPVQLDRADLFAKAQPPPTGRAAGQPEELAER
jgi:hypothetical protein